ncbi:MAG: molybdopterin adenylyltransferase [Chrysiogenales bacterium]|nr:MAG: molybdopterin adenylyltransferase [Chrysiogenales bacterium]
MTGVRVGIVTISDRSSQGLRDDRSGPEIRVWAEKMGFVVSEELVIPDEFNDIAKALRALSDSGVDIILTTGGTGFTPRDVTPEATRSVIEKEAPGFTEVMRMRSLQITPHAMLSRAVAGIRKKSLIINLPGSPRAVRENLGFIEAAIPHAVEMLRSAVTDCGGE